MTEIDDFYADIREQNRRARAAVRSFVSTAVSGDVKRFGHSIVEVDVMFVWREAMRAISKHPTVPEEICAGFLAVWIRSGDHIRGEVRGDTVLSDGLRVLLPRYNGPTKRLYRGDSFFNRKRRTYGLSWSTKIEVAESFAQGIWQTFDGGSVLLETVAPPAAIICAPFLVDNRYGEDEYIVDRRRLAQVRVVVRFPQRPI